MTTNDPRIEEIRVWFDERGYELIVHQGGDVWRAPYMPKGSRIGSADYGVGKTPLEAAEDAKAQRERGTVFEKTGSVTSAASVSGSAEKHVIQPPGIPSEEAFGLPEVQRTIEETLTGHGWRVWFEPEPDGSVTGLLSEWESGEV